MMKKIKIKHLITIALVISLFIVGNSNVWAITDEKNGDWNSNKVIIKNTSEAQLMVRVGDIDNFGFKFYGIDPFSGIETQRHAFPFFPKSNDWPNTDKIMVISGYNSANKYIGYNTDGYTRSYSIDYLHSNRAKAITIPYAQELEGIVVRNAVLQMFVDDIQPGNAHGILAGNVNYSVTINDVAVPELSSIINNLDQSGPRGKLITFSVPERLLYLIEEGEISVKIDDPRSGRTGDGYAVDFMKLLINVKELSNVATVSGFVVDENNERVQGATVTSGGVVSTITDSNGEYTLLNVPAGQAVITASKSGNISQSKTLTTVIEGGGYELNFLIESDPKPETPTFMVNTTEPTNLDIIMMIHYSDNSLIKRYKINDGMWQNYTGLISIRENATIKAQSISDTGNESDIGVHIISNIDKEGPLAPEITLSTTEETTDYITCTIEYTQDSLTRVYKIGTGNWKMYNGPIEITKNATVYAKAFDELNNESTEATLNITNIIDIVDNIQLTDEKGSLMATMIEDGSIILKIDFRLNEYANGLSLKIKTLQDNNINKFLATPIKVMMENNKLDEKPILTENGTIITLNYPSNISSNNYSTYIRLDAAHNIHEGDEYTFKIKSINVNGEEIESNKELRLIVVPAPDIV